MSTIAVKFKIEGGAVPGNWTEIDFYGYEIRNEPVIDGRKSIIKRLGTGLPKIIKKTGFGNINITFVIYKQETLKKLQLLETLARDADNIKVYPAYVSNPAKYRIVIMPTGQIPDEVLIAGRNSGGQDITIDFLESEKYISDDFPITQNWYRNEEENNLLSVTDGTEIYVTAIDTVANTITLSYLPFVESIWNPISGQEWALMNLENISGADPCRTGDYTEGFKITGGNFSTKVLNYDIARGSEGNWNVNDKVLLFNPYEGAWTIPATVKIIEQSGSGWRATSVSPGPLFKHSNGNWIILINGIGASGNSIGAFQTSDINGGTWTVMNSDAAIFTASGVSSDWRESQLFASGSVHRLSDGRYMAFVSGYSNTTTKWKIGWIKFDEDFLNISYASAEIIDSSGSSNGFIAPSVVKWNGEYKMLFTDRSDNANPNSATGGWKLKDANCATIDGTYIVNSTIFAGNLSNDGIYCSSHIDNCFAFVWKETLYVLTGGTSWYKHSGNRGNRVTGLIKYDVDSDSWIEDTKSPIFAGWPYGNDFWNFTWGYDHLGGYPCLIINGEDRLCYFFLSASIGGVYGVIYVKLDLGFV